MKLRYFLPLVSLFLFFHSCSVTQQAYWGEELPVDCERNCILDKIEKAKISSSTPEEGTSHTSLTIFKKHVY